jgi:hypothetical protein
MNTDLTIKKPYTSPRVEGKFLIRVALSPLLFLYGIMLLGAGSLFPLPFLIMLSIAGIISKPFVWMLRKGGTDINYIEPFFGNYKDFNLEKNIVKNHFIGLTIYFWGAFAVSYHYIKTGKIWNP